MNVLGISPLDRDATACLLVDGEVRTAVAEERFSRVKMHSGFPQRSIDHILETNGLRIEDIDHVAYPFLEWRTERQLILKCLFAYLKKNAGISRKGTFRLLRHISEDIYQGDRVPGLPDDDWLVKKKAWKRVAYLLGGGNTIGDRIAGMATLVMWAIDAIKDHRHFHQELTENLKKMGLLQKLVRYDHHQTHAANAFYTSGFPEALIVTLDAYGGGLGGSISLGNKDGIKRLHNLQFPNSLGLYYESITSALGFTPSRHEGKVVGLAAYGDAEVLKPVIASRFHEEPGNFLMISPNNYFFNRHLCTKFTKMTLAAAHQRVLEEVTHNYVKHFIEKTQMKNVTLSGGVIANVKNNQTIFEIPGVEKIFVHPNMGDGGCSVGAAILCSRKEDSAPKPINDVYYGPEYSEADIRSALEEANLEFEKPDDIETRVATLIHEGHIVARFNGRMEYGPRALGNRSILYHAKDPEVNLWLNQQLGRTEFMPFAPATLYEHRHTYFEGIDGAEYAAEFMTITFSCTEKMISECPAAVHVDHTARPQLVRKEVNPSFHKIIEAYGLLSGTFCVINTSFNIHEEPIVCTPHDAIRAFQKGHIPYLAIGPLLVKSGD